MYGTCMQTHTVMQVFDLLIEINRVSSIVHNQMFAFLWSCNSNSVPQPGRRLSISVNLI